MCDFDWYTRPVCVLLCSYVRCMHERERVSMPTNASGEHGGEWSVSDRVREIYEHRSRAA